MKITKSSWNDYVAKLGRIDRRAAIEMEAWLNKYGTVDTNALIEQAYAIANKYGHAAASLACQMYDSVAEASGALVPAAEPAEVASISEVAKAVNGTKSSQPNLINAISRLPRLAAADTMLKNSLRDGAQHAWIPSGDSCAFCFALASRGWEYSSKELIKRGHAEHIHANCDCTFAIRFNSRDDVEGYDPDTMRDEWENSGSNTRTRMNNMRQKFRLENREKINAQKRALYEKNVDGDNLREYNNSPIKKKLSDSELLKQYESSVEEGWISALCGFDNYKKQYDYLYDNLIGKETSTGIEIKNISKHFMDRVIGTGEDPITKHIRSGTEPEGIVDTLLNAKPRPIRLDPETGRMSQLFCGDDCNVSINPETGMLIQCNPN